MAALASRWTANERAAGKCSGWAACASIAAALRGHLRGVRAGSPGPGYAPELGRAALAFAFEIAKLDRVVAITRLDNIASQRSLEKFMAREREITTDEGRTLVLYAAFNPNSGRRNHTGRINPK